MNIQIVELGLVGRETMGNPDPDSDIVETGVKTFKRSLEDDDGL